MYEEGIDYRFFDIENDNEPGVKVTAIELAVDNYENVVYHYLKVRVVEEGAMARLQFGYTILDSAKHDIDELNNDEKFHTIMGDILTDILLKQQNYEKTGTDNSQEPDIQ
jgi:hypothetical protein